MQKSLSSRTKNEKYPNKLESLHNLKGVDVSGARSRQIPVGIAEEQKMTCSDGYVRLRPEFQITNQLSRSDGSLDREISKETSEWINSPIRFLDPERGLEDLPMLKSKGVRPAKYQLDKGKYEFEMGRQVETFRQTKDIIPDTSSSEVCSCY